mgnify:CR=1 FL=1
MSEYFELDESHVGVIVAAHMETWQKDTLSVQLGPTFLNAFYKLAIADEQTLALGIRKKTKSPTSAWCLGFRQYNSFNAKLKSQMGLGLHILVAKKMLSRALSLSHLIEAIFGEDQARAVQFPESHLGAFGCVGKEFDDVLLLAKLIKFTAAEICKSSPACWAVTNENNKGAKMVMTRANFNRIDTILAKNRTLGIYEFSAAH